MTHRWYNVKWNSFSSKYIRKAIKKHSFIFWTKVANVDIFLRNDNNNNNSKCCCYCCCCCCRCFVSYNEQQQRNISLKKSLNRTKHLILFFPKKNAHNHHYFIQIINCTEIAHFLFPYHHANVIFYVPWKLWKKSI